MVYAFALSLNKSCPMEVNLIILLNDSNNFYNNI